VRSDWSELAKRWTEYDAPFRPTEDIVKIFENGAKGKTLLLGATPELQHLASLALDNNLDALKIHKPSVSILADWRAVPLLSGCFDTVIGDGSLNVLNNGYKRLFPEIRRILKPDGKLLLRVYTTPEKQDTLEAVIANKNRFRGFWAFKLAIYQALANPFVKVKDVQEAVSIWEHPSSKIKRDLDSIFYFPKLSELPPWSNLQYATSYELAERCPVITWEMNHVNLV
jgi:SAM-dependent methyltransferase